MIIGGSDHMIGHDKNQAVNPYNPFLGIWTSVTRKTVAGSVVHPEQKISRQEALKAYTINGAYMVGADKGKGSIEPGKLADMVIIDRDFLTCPEDEIGRIEPVTVFIEGRKVWGN